MRPLWKDILAAVWLGILLPGIVLNAFVLKERHQEVQPMSSQPVMDEQNESFFITVRDSDGTCLQMDINAYLTGVILAEMPAEFHEEALKAQSVAARTYTWKAYTTGGKHGDGSVCTDSACCQAFIAEDTYLARGGTQENQEKVRKTLQSTTGMVLVYEGELIEATYFSSSGGSTESSMAVWGADYPYLQPVSSPEEPQEETVTFSAEEFQKLLDQELSGHPSEWFGTVNVTDGGGVASIEICGETYTGQELRSLLRLRSTDFRIQTDQQSVTITTRGYGHRVGMSQHGANTMAEAGSTWQAILQHYYPGTTLIPAY